MKMDFSKILFRASGVGNLMIGSQKIKNQSDECFYTDFKSIGETTKKYLTAVMISKVYGRDKELMNKYVQKGIMVEEESITLYSRVSGKFFSKNYAHLQNDYTEGTPDLFEGQDILRAKKITDIKSSYDIYTFWNAKRNDLNMMYYWQLQTYMSLTGAQESELAYCLVDKPETIIEGEKRRFMWDAGIKGEDEYNHEVFEMIEKLAHYDDIPINERIYIIKILRNEEDIERLHRRIILTRQWMNIEFTKND